MKKFILLLISINILIVTSGLSQDIFKEDNNLYSTEMILTSKPFSENRSLYISAATSLKGSISITVTDSDKITVRYYKKAKTTSKSKAIDYIDLITIYLKKTQSGFKLLMRSPNPPPWVNNEAGIVSLEIELPAFCDIEIDAVLFDVKAEGPFNNFLVPTSLGKLTVENVSGYLELATSNRRLSVSNLTGAVKIATTNSVLYATDINSPNKKIIIRNEGGDINMSDITGELNIKNKYGRINIDNYKPSGLLNKIRCNNGPIIISIAEINSEQLLISNNYEDIEIYLPSEISAELSLAVEEGGKIEVTNLPFKTDLVQPNRLNLITKNGSALINGSIRGQGNIYLKGQDEEE